MAILKTQLPEIAFPFELDTLVFESDGENFTQVSIEYDGRTLIDEILYFDVNGELYIEDLASLLIDYLEVKPISLKTFSVSVGGATSSTSVIPCMVDLSVPAVEYVDAAFLSSLMGPKKTYLNGIETLAFYESGGTEQGDLKILTYQAEMLTDEGVIVTLSKKNDGEIDVGISIIDVSPDTIMEIFGQPDGRLMSYTVTAGKRIQKYIVQQYAAQEVVRFFNSFLQEDTFYFSHLENEVKPTRTYANVRGERRVVAVDPVNTSKGTSYPLLDSELPLADDIICAKDVWLPQKYMITITDNEFKHNTDATDLPRVSITWQPELKRQWPYL